ncbi:aminoglycoside phosphotransferase family protein [Kribbella sp. NPDC056861]|uniref:aminoglycoside phosphotransferase family protein n=1 Tax=Kribbella sp. NPDC056861 TaxID=3154857 RepID=UPI00341A3D15
MIELPGTFLAMPRWWSEGQHWLAELPAAVERQCDHWGLEPDGAISHGSNAIAIRVTRSGEPLVLRMTPPGPDVAEQAEALRWWDGRGMVRLYAADLPNGAMLLERLGSSLSAEPIGEAMTVLGQLMRRLAVPAPPDVPSTAAIAGRRATELEADWQRYGQPFDAALLDETLAIAPQLSESSSELAVNGDFHSDQVLRGAREPWLVVDPLLYRGDLEYDLARMLWTRLDEMETDAEIREHFGTVVQEAGLSEERARNWVVFRTVSYWLWGLSAGLTEDPERCRRLLAAFR